MVDREALNNKLYKLGYKSYEEIVEEFQHNVYSTVYTFIQNAQDTEDISQEVFLLIYQNLNSFKLDSKLSTWIYRITVNRCLTYRRKEARRNTIAKFVPISNEMSESLKSNISVDLDVIKLEDKDILYKALNCINKKYVTVIVLRYMQDLSIKEIGQILNLPARTVETQLYRAKSKLKANLLMLGYGMEEKCYGL